MTKQEASKLAVFEGKRIRKTLHEGEWWFVVEDVVLALIESRDPKQCIQRMKQRDPELGKGQGTNCTYPFDDLKKHYTLSWRQNAGHGMTRAFASATS